MNLNVQKHIVNTHNPNRRLLTFFSFMLFFFALILPNFAYADPLGEHILAAILRNEKPSDGALLLMTRDLKWYEQNMGMLKPEIQARVQQLRINAGGEASRMSARKLNEAGSVFAATGSWKPGRDMDIIYFGRNGDLAASTISESYETVTGRIIADAADDPILRSFQKTGGTVPRTLAAECLAVCTTELPNYGYTDLHNAYKKAQQALARGESKDDIMKALHKEIREAMGSNMKAHFAAAANPDYYAGATGQDWFRKTYLDDTERMRVFAQDADGNWALRSGGIKAVPDEITGRLGFGSLDTSSQIKFSKIASDYSLFFSHMHGGPSDNAKYALRVWKDMGLNAIQNLTDDQLRILATAKIISNNPDRAARILSDMGIGSVDEFNEGIARILHGWTEGQLVLNMESIMAKLAGSSARAADDFDELHKLFRQSKATMELNEIVAGLNKLSAVPDGKVLQTQLLEKLRIKFGNTDIGRAAMSLILKNLGLLGETGELTGRIMAILARTGKITDAELEAYRAGRPLSGRVQGRVNQVKKELLALNAGGMVEFENTLDMEKLMNDWRTSQPGAILQSADDDITKIVNELHEFPDEQLRKLGWTAEELAVQNRIRNYLRSNKQMMPSLGARLQERLGKAGIRLSDVQHDVRMLMFNPAYTKLGDPSMSVGAFDAIIGSAAALFQTYTILNGPSMKEEDENIALSNAWAVAIPVVGDFAQGLITGSEGYWEGDKKKMLEAGLWMTVGVTGLVPGGQLPAVIGSMVLAMKPVAEGVYEARQAQNLVQAWIESGKWSTGKGPKLEGIYDRSGLLHRLTYDEILGAKGEVKYDSRRIKSIPFGEFTIAQSVRDYANKYVLAGNRNVDMFRENLKTMLPELGDNVLNDLAYGERKIKEKNSKLAMMFFKAYERQIRGAYVQTISHLKKWAEDERRVERDYDGEVKRLRAELADLEKELKNASLVKHADDTVNSYTKIATNLFEQESLPLSKVRIYENYIAAYKQIKNNLQAVGKLFAEASSKYVPSSWFLTGYPVFDKDITGRLLTLMAAERERSADRVTDLLKDMNQKDTYLNLRNECHKKAFDIIAAQRYKIAFSQHLAEYYKGLVEESSKWSDAYESAKNAYENTRDSILKTLSPQAALIDNAYVNAFSTFFFAMGFAVASNDADSYRKTAAGYEAQTKALREQDRSDRTAGTKSETGKALEQCLTTGLQLEIQLSTASPEAGTNIEAAVKLVKGTLPKETSWAWEGNGGLTVKPRFGEKTTVKADSDGELIVRLMDERYVNKSITESKVKIIPKKKDGVFSEKEKAEREYKEKEKSEQKTERLTVTLSADKLRLKPGDILSVRAAVSGGKPDYRYTWTGDHAGSGPSVTFTSRKQGVQTLSVQVQDGSGQTAASSISFTVEDIKVSISGLKNSAVYGQTMPVSVKITGMPATASADMSAAVAASMSKTGGPYEETYIGDVSPGEDCASLDPKFIKAKENERTNKEAKRRQDYAAKRHADAEKQYKDCINSCISMYKNTQSCEKSFCRKTSREEAGKLHQACSKNPMGGKCEEYFSNILSGRTSRTREDKTGFIRCCKDTRGTYAPCVEVKQKTERQVKTEQSMEVAWHSSPNVTFADHKENTTVTFDRMGKVKIWAQISVITPEGKQTFESDQQEVNVVAPRFTWKFNPPKGSGQIGREVRASITTNPHVDPKLLSYEWSMPESSNRMQYETNGSAIGFTPKSTASVRLLVSPKTPYHREPIGGGLQEEYQAKGVVITITGPKARQEFQMWKCETQLGGAHSCGMKKVENQFAVDNEILFSSKIEPMPEKPVSYNWTSSPAGCATASPFSKDTGIKCSSTGNFTVMVKAKSDGIDLGSASASVNVSISQNDLNSSKKAKDAHEKLAKAKEMVLQGRLDEAIGLAEEAVKLDPENTEAQAVSTKLKSEKERVLKQLDKTTKLMDESKFEEAKRELIVAKNLHGKYKPVIDLEQKLESETRGFNDRIRDRFNEVNSASEKKEFRKSLELIKKIRADMKLAPQNEKELKRMEDFAVQHVSSHDNLAKEGADLERQGKLKEALDKYLGARNFMPDPQVDAHIKDIQSKLGAGQRKVQKAAEVRAEAENFQKENKIREAIAKYKEYVTYVPDDKDIKNRISDLETRQRKEQAKTEHARQERDRGEVFEKQNRIPEAVAKYKEYMKYVPDDAAMAKHIAGLEIRLKAQQVKVEYAKDVRAQGEALQRQGKVPEAIDKYKEYMKYVPDDKAMAKHVADLESGYKARQVKAQYAMKVREEGVDLQKQKKIPEAIAKYKEYLSYVPDDQKMANYVSDLENNYKAQQEKAKYAKDVRAQGDDLLKQVRISEAIAKFKEYLVYVPNDTAMAKQINDLELLLNDMKAQQQKARYAAQLRAQGEALQKQNKIPEAIAKYKEYLTHMPADQVMTMHMVELEKIYRDQQRKQYIIQLRNEGTALQNQGKIPEAIARFKEYLRYQPDPAMEKHVKDLEARLLYAAGTGQTDRNHTSRQPQRPVPSGTRANNEDLLFGFYAVLYNESSTKTDLRFEGEKGDYTIIEPGKNRSYSGFMKGLTIKAMAFNNGQKIAECSWTISESPGPGRQMHAIFRDPANLECLAGDYK